MPTAELLWMGVAAGQMAASLGVTVHTLLHRRNTVAATAWIGLAWFAPLFGALLYLVLGINRVERRARRLHRPAQPLSGGPPPFFVVDPLYLRPLDTAMERITGRPCAAGTTVDVLRHGDAAYPCMLDAIADARSTIALTSYIFRDDVVGRTFIDALAAAAARGVQVRVLIDAVGGGYLRTPAWRRLRARGVPAARFLHSHLPWRTPILNLRSHRKLLVVDGAVAFTGGLNIGMENLPGTPVRRVHRDAVRDTHFRLEGPIVSQVMAVFAEDWRFTTGETLAGSKWFPVLVPCGPGFARVVTSGPDHELERIKAALLTALSVAQTRIRVLTPYFMPDEPLMLALALAALRGVDVGIVLPERSDNRLVDWGTRDGLVPLLAAGCRIWRSAPPFDHSKLMTVDGSWSMVGSANWDTRSLRLNFELNLEIRDPALATQLDALIEAHGGRAVHVRDLMQRTLPVRLRDAAARLLLPYV